MTTITFLGGRQDIIDPDAAVTAARQTTEPVNSNRRNHPQPASLGMGYHPDCSSFRAVSIARGSLHCPPEVCSRGCHHPADWDISRLLAHEPR